MTDNIPSLPVTWQADPHQHAAAPATLPAAASPSPIAYTLFHPCFGPVSAIDVKPRPSRSYGENRPVWAGCHRLSERTHSHGLVKLG